MEYSSGVAHAMPACVVHRTKREGRFDGPNVAVAGRRWFPNVEPDPQVRGSLNLVDFRGKLPFEVAYGVPGARLREPFNGTSRKVGNSDRQRRGHFVDFEEELKKWIILLSTQCCSRHQ